MTLRAQDLKHRIEFQRYRETQNEWGDIIHEWVTYRTMYARADPLMGREYFAAETSQASIDYKFTCRFFPEPLPKDRIVMDGKVFDVFSVINVRHENRELLLYAKTNAN